MRNNKRGYLILYCIMLNRFLPVNGPEIYPLPYVRWQRELVDGAIPA